MRHGAMPVLWVSGAPGTGKSTVGWSLYTAIAGQGGSVSYVDIDQLGLIGPPPGGGEESHRIKIDNLVRLLKNLKDLGVQQVVVSGVVDPELGIEHYLTGRHDLTHIEISLVRLTCSRENLRARFLGRGSPPQLLEELYALADRLNRSDIGEQFDTSDDSPNETAHRLLGRCIVASEPDGYRTSQRPIGRVAPLPVAVVSGATATGKSAASWRALTLLWNEDVGAAFVDAQQLGFVHPAPPPGFIVSQVVELSSGYKKAGAAIAIVVSRDPDVVAEAADRQTMSLVVLEVDAVEHGQRIASRAAGHYAFLAGDELSGATRATQLKILDRARREAEALRAKFGTSGAVDSSDQSVDQTASEILDEVRSLLRLSES